MAEKLGESPTEIHPGAFGSQRQGRKTTGRPNVPYFCVYGGGMLLKNLLEVNRSVEREVLYVLVFPRLLLSGFCMLLVGLL